MLLCLKATDTSQSQIDNAHAPEGTHVEFKVGDAHDTGLPGGQADLVTIAQALHWLDRPRFYNEASRLLRPGGALCILTYDFGHLKLLPSDSNGDAEAANKLLAKIWDFGSTSDAFGPYWAAPRTLVDNRYRGESVPSIIVI